ncbi:WD repeat-containing protein WRAP73 isoform X1 [Eptesicus fuscus]|uniref:WD repeat-containing protein WRAP73 isoform X1 n=1 Tax=Eptesicus fuscus TaxID=29078 RepID=UPI002403E9E3|nr:WD repeat-containing protein WRAP73 isoform X1 [Eptesicus fuscus]
MNGSLRHSLTVGRGPEPPPVPPPQAFIGISIFRSSQQGLLRAVPPGGPRGAQPSDPPAVHLPGPGPARRVVGRLPLHPVRHVQAGAGAGVVAGAARVALQDRRGLRGAGGLLLEPRRAPHPQHHRVPPADHRLVLVHKVRLVHQVPEGLSAGNRLLPGRPLPGLGREAGLQGLRQHLRLQRLAAAAGKCARDTLATSATRQAHVPSDRLFRRDLLLPFPWQHFDTDTQDLAGIEWAPNGCVLAAWDTCLEYKVLLYSLDGRLLAAFCAYEWSLGIKSVAWSPSSQFLAVGSYDGKVRILNHVTWKMLTEFGHPAAISDPRVVVYKEAEKSPRGALGRPACPPPRAAESKYEIATGPVSLQTLKPAADRANPKIGVGALAFSPDSYFLATRNDNVPNAVWVWDMQKLRLFVVLEQLGPVRSFQWDPQQPRLAICSGGSKVYLWSPAGCVSVQVPGEGDFQVLSLCWHVTGASLALLSKDHFCLCFLETEDEADGALRQLGAHT